MEIISQPIIKVYPSYSVLYYRPTVDLPRHSVAKNSLDNLKLQHFKGEISNGIKRKMRTILTAWIESVRMAQTQAKQLNYSIPEYFAFVTLTIPQSTEASDKWLYKNLFYPFIQTLKRNYRVDHYLWKAETQNNGNIHWHLLIDKYIDKRDIQREWNNQLWQRHFLFDYYVVHGRTNAPSTHVRAITGVTDLVSYVLKYISKNVSKSENARRLIDGKVWGCSDSLRKLSVYSYEIDVPELDMLFSRLKSDKKHLITDDRFILINVKSSYIFDILGPLEQMKYSQHYLNVYNFLYRNIPLSPVPTKKVLENTVIVKPTVCEQLSFDWFEDVPRVVDTTY